MNTVRTVRSLLAAALLATGSVAATAAAPPAAARGDRCLPEDAAANRHTWLTAVTPPAGCSVQDRHPARLTAWTAVIRLLPPPPRWAFPPAATLTDADTGLPVPGQTIAFATGGTPLCAAVTDATGQAVCARLRDLPYGARQGWYTARYAGDTVREPAGALGRLVSVGHPGHEGPG